MQINVGTHTVEYYTAVRAVMYMTTGLNLTNATFRDKSKNTRHFQKGSMLHVFTNGAKLAQFICSESQITLGGGQQHQKGRGGAVEVL